MDFIAGLKKFRQAAYKYLCRAHDATFELTDAVLLTRNAYSLADLSLSPVFRRKWSSIYEALQETRPQRSKLMRLYIEQIPLTERIILAGDHTAWSRPDARTLRERTIEHYTTGVPGNRPITKGQGYSAIACIPETEGSWALPLRDERITSWETPKGKAVWQLKQVCRYLPLRPLSLWDCEYGCATPVASTGGTEARRWLPFVLKTANIPADKLMRLRSNLCLWTAPATYSARGRPCIHGNKFRLNHRNTRFEPAQTLEVDDSNLGLIRISVWHQLHFPAAAKHQISLLLVERLNSNGSIRVAKPLWLAWVGQQMPAFGEVWRLYLWRFAVDHCYRFALAAPALDASEVSYSKTIYRESDLMPLMTWELWLARDIVTDKPLPWQKSIAKFTPARVAQSMGGILATIGTPASPPKPRGKSPLLAAWATPL